VVKAVFIDSDNADMPPHGIDSNSYPRQFIAERLQRYGNQDCFYSRRRAETFARSLKTRGGV
jgi:hypothetical protein